MQYKANSLPVNNVAKSYIESHLNLGTLLISQDIFYTDFESIKNIEQILHKYSIFKCYFIKFYIKIYCAIVTKKNSIFNFPPLIFHRHQDNLRHHHKMLSSLCRLESFSRKNYCQQIPMKVSNSLKHITMKLFIYYEIKFFCLCCQKYFFVA